MDTGHSADSLIVPILLRKHADGSLNYTRILATLAVVYIGVLLLQALARAFTSPLRHVPGPSWSRFTRLPLKKAIVSGRRIFFIDDLHRKYGDVVRIAPDEVSVADVDGFKKIHSVSSKFVKDGWYEELTIFPRQSVFTMQNKELHSARRKLFAKGFSKTYLRENYEGIIAEKARLAVEGIKKRALAGPVDILQWWTFLATDTVGQLGFGESFGMLEKGEKTDYIMTLERALVGNGIGAEMPLIRTIGSLLPGKVPKQMFKATDYILEYGQKAVDNAKSQKSETNLMANVLKEAEKENSSLDDLDVRVEATSLIFAGSGTTANTLSYFIWSVLKDPSLQEKIEDEVAKLPADFKDVDLEKLRWMNATLEETLRLYAAVPGSLPRIVPKGGVTIAGHYIPEGTTVGTQAYTLHRKEGIWPDAHSFKPERWLKESDLSAAAKTVMSAFGAGAYTCLGIHIAYMEMRYAAALFFRECRGAKLAASTTDKSMEMQNYFVITPKSHMCEITLQ
ncbi:uncharacterized protein PV09_03258 [Verruconis gallopava]|uniref:Uncharacterized protein n=1 Tax=Verruconis gallopava TaxID=253628 RepID=A0A0D1YZG9_9PEZI|nr:uncharacterized protein PV09_03258 [Verruconis gallopava]KIW06087.1 hypothetical protein PV09_03258 [Verruconis gallopava]